MDPMAIFNAIELDAGVPVLVHLTEQSLARRAAPVRPDARPEVEQLVEVYEAGVVQVDRAERALDLR